jgi:hypothetical protein
MKNVKTLLIVMLLSMATCIQASAQNKSQLKIASYDLSTTQPNYHNAVYVTKTGLKLRSRNVTSDNDGKNWQTIATQTDNVPAKKSDRLTPVTSVFDPNTNYLVTFFNSLDNGNNSISKLSREPVEGQKQYYLRYRVSADNGKSWLFEKPVVQADGNYSKENSFPGVIKGKSAIYIGDLGSVPIVIKSGNILLPTQTTLSDDNGGLFNPGGGYTYMDVMVLIGSWNKDGSISWKPSQRVKGDPRSTTRGLIEPTITELNDGRILMIMRGSNGGKLDKNFNLPGYKWFCISSDGGMNWTKPAPLTYDDNSNFYSPSSMSVLFHHSSGRIFWVGNITPDNPKGDSPRFPLVMGEINGSNGKLIKSSVVTLDTIKESDKSKGKVDISHVTVIEDRATKSLIITYQRNYSNYKTREWASVKIAL